MIVTINSALPPADDDDDDDDGDDDGEPIILGYDVLVLIGILAIVSVILIQKSQK